jgi:hypothetical protein
MVNPPEATLGLTSHSLTSSSSPTDEPAMDANANAVPSVSDATVAASDVETQCADATTTTAEELVECIATTIAKPIASILHGSATFP